jgi:ABC-type sugar transport system permease subunit
MSLTIALEDIFLGMFMAWFAWFSMHYFNIYGGYVASRILGFKSAVVEYDSYFGMFQKPSGLDIDDDEIYGSGKKRSLSLLVVLSGILIGTVPLVILLSLPLVITKNPSIYAASFFSAISILIYLYIAFLRNARSIYSLIRGERINETGNMPEQQT